MSRERRAVEWHGEAWVTARKDERYGRARIPGRCGKCAPKCSRAPGDEVHEFPWAVVDLSVSPARLVSYARCGASSERIVWRIMSALACEACGTDFDDFEHPVCSCNTCADCGEAYKEHDVLGVRFASSEEIAGEFGEDTLKCDACWAKVLA